MRPTSITRTVAVQLKIVKRVIWSLKSMLVTIASERRNAPTLGKRMGADLSVGADVLHSGRGTGWLPQAVVQSHSDQERRECEQ